MQQICQACSQLQPGSKGSQITAIKWERWHPEAVQGRKTYYVDRSAHGLPETNQTTYQEGFPSDFDCTSFCTTTEFGVQPTVQEVHKYGCRFDRLAETPKKRAAHPRLSYIESAPVEELQVTPGQRDISIDAFQPSCTAHDASSKTDASKEHPRAVTAQQRTGSSTNVHCTVKVITICSGLGMSTRQMPWTCSYGQDIQQDGLPLAVAQYGCEHRKTVRRSLAAQILSDLT